jgi:hypothetical protein
MVNVYCWLFLCFSDIKISVDTMNVSQLAPYDDEEEIQLMDTDGNNLQLDEQLLNTNENFVEKKNEEEPIEEQEEKKPSILVIEVCFI